MARKRVLVIGWCGGVGTALLELLDTKARALPIADRIGALYLVDRASTESSTTAVTGACVLPAADCNDPDTVARILRDFAIDEVIEVADVDTPSMSAVCARHGADYISASIHCRDRPTITGASELLGARPVVAASHLLGAGMNPGIVNALVLAGVEELARRARVSIGALALAGIHVTEQDTTRSVEGVDAEVFAMSWSPTHALEEILESQAMYVARGRPATLDHRPLDHLYVARCGDDEIAAMIVPHEELVSIGARFPDVESAFFYSIPFAYPVLRRHPDRAPHEWPIRRLYPPHTRRLSGHDRVGVLIASRRYGELWIGFEHDAACARAGAHNATTLQAAAGVLAGWMLLGTRRGIHVVDELDDRKYLELVEVILGGSRIVHVPDAHVRTVSERRRPGEVLR